MKALIQALLLFFLLWATTSSATYRNPFDAALCGLLLYWLGGWVVKTNIKATTPSLTTDPQANKVPSQPNKEEL